MKAPKETKLITPLPYVQLNFSCSNRDFFEVKNDLYDLGVLNGLEPEDGYMEEVCDYEGDLSKIIVYNGEREKPFFDLVAKAYGIDSSLIRSGINIHLCC